MPEAPGYRPQLDGLRAVAVAGVAWSHWERDYQAGIPFGAGVHLFFVLSGFLITNILLDIRLQPDRWDGLRAFYIRRALRIFPAFYLTLLLAWIADVPLVRQTVAWHAAYLSNVWIFRENVWPGSISHLWSLAVEEQFYLAWPWLVVFTPRRWLVPAMIACTAAAPVFRAVLAADGYRESMLALLTPGCLDSLGMGALLAVTGVAWKRSGASPDRATRTVRWNVAVAAIAAAWILLLASDAAGTSPPLALLAIKQTLQAIVFTWIVWRAAQGFGGAPGRFLSAPAVVYIGRISYGIYLAHGFAGEILATVGIASASLPEPLRLIALAGVSVGVAALSWHLMERPINALKGRVPYAAISRAAVPA